MKSSSMPAPCGSSSSGQARTPRRHSFEDHPIHEAMVFTSDNAAYFKAVALCPSLLETESPHELFLKFHDYNVWDSAQRLANYWSLRENLFGEESAFLPLIDALEDEDVDNLVQENGMAILLPPSVTGNGRFSTFWDRALINHQDSACPNRRQSRSRCDFFLHQQLMMMSPRGEYDLIMNIDTSRIYITNLDKAMGAKVQRRTQAFCTRRLAIHFVMISPPAGASCHSSLSSWLTAKIIQCASVATQSTILLHMGTISEVGASLESAGMSPSGIPRQCGGKFVHDRDWGPVIRKLLAKRLLPPSPPPVAAQSLDLLFDPFASDDEEDETSLRLLTLSEKPDFLGCATNGHEKALCSSIKVDLSLTSSMRNDFQNGGAGLEQAKLEMVEPDLHDVGGYSMQQSPQIMGAASLLQMSKQEQVDHAPIPHPDFAESLHWSTTNRRSDVGNNLRNEAEEKKTVESVSQGSFARNVPEFERLMPNPLMDVSSVSDRTKPTTAIDIKSILDFGKIRTTNGASTGIGFGRLLSADGGNWAEKPPKTSTRNEPLRLAGEAKTNVYPRALSQSEVSLASDGDHTKPNENIKVDETVLNEPLLPKVEEILKARAVKRRQQNIAYTKRYRAKMKLKRAQKGKNRSEGTAVRKPRAAAESPSNRKHERLSASPPTRSKKQLR